MMGEGARKSILVVDDTPENIDVLRGILSSHYTVKVATSGQLALKVATSAKPPDLILLDVMMPEMDGYDVCRRLKADERTRGIPVIFVTAKSEVEDETLGFSLGAADYVVKPVSAPLVLARVGTQLALHDRARHLEGLVRERTANLQAKIDELEKARQIITGFENALDELSLLNQSIIARTDSGVLVFKSSGECVLANEASARILGGTLTQIQQKDLRSLAAWFDPGLQAAAEQALSSGVAQRNSFRIRRGDGKDGWSITSLCRIDRKDGLPYLLAVFTDVTAFKELELAMQRANASAEIALGRADAAERRILSISEDTQQRIGQELHDDLGQHLTGIAFMSEVLSRKLISQDHPAVREVSSITRLINEAISKTRQLAHGLYPVEIKEAGLAAMLGKLAGNVETIYGIACEFVWEEHAEVQDRFAMINLFRIAQEAVNNAAKHSTAKKITVRLASKQSAIVLEIADDGCGISRQRRAGAQSGLGMHTMQHRASLIGATLHVGEPPGGGTSIAVTLPPS
ncbi:MAG TPA: response regulator [Terriglobales bacterium]|nr:response regulator [Terriglobales bacterium]